jgi:hypothetical protein
MALQRRSPYCLPFEHVLGLAVVGLETPACRPQCPDSLSAIAASRPSAAEDRRPPRWIAA